MNLHPWGLWHVDGTPEAGTEEIVATLESVIRSAIPITWARFTTTSTPWKPPAVRNARWPPPTGSPRWLRPPDTSCTCPRTSTSAPAITRPRSRPIRQAAAVDRAYIKASGAQGIYPMMYYSHNLHFIAMCAAMNGNYPEAKKNADMLAAHVAPRVKEMPPLEGFMTIPMAVDVRFHKWDSTC